MQGWDWLTRPTYNWRFVRRVLMKTALLLIVVNILYLALNPLPYLSRLTLYNGLFTGRERLPFSELNPDEYSVPLHRLEGLLASHVISDTPKAPDEFRVVVLGDSGVWGWRLQPDETMTACLTDSHVQIPDGRVIHAYNLAYPYPAVLKDALILQQVLVYEPDVVLWFITLKALYIQDQTWHPLVQNNPDLAQHFVEDYAVNLDLSPLFPEPSNLLGELIDLIRDRSILGQRRELADLLRHQVYGPAWTLTSYDYEDPRFFRPLSNDLLPNNANRNYTHIPEGTDLATELAWDVLRAVVEIAQGAGVGVLVVNEPIFRATGANSDRYYNELYDRWAYDAYRDLLPIQAAHDGWDYVDVWDALPNDVFSEYSLHYQAAAGCGLMQRLVPDMVGAELSAAIPNRDSYRRFIGG
ncbi:MAG: hypothetical protein H6673_13425 [Anaerolineales bacterium]|nr:hypothetical protein [Anaerolineales bacterium]